MISRLSRVFPVYVVLTLATLTAAAADSITIYAGSDVGDVSYITGFLHGYSNLADCDQAAVAALKPRHFRTGAEPVMQLADALDAEMTVVISDFYARKAGGYPKSRPWENWEEWEQLVLDSMKMIEETYTFPEILWDVWNEPDSSYFWPGTREQYLEMVYRAYTVIKAHNPNYKVVGPCWSPYTPKLGGLANLLDELDEKWGVRFDCVVWHENGPPDPHEFPYHVRALRDDLHRLIAPDYNPPFQINEYESSMLHLVPGRQVCWLSYFEQEGVTCTARACWPVYTGTPPDITIYNDCWNGLNGMFMPDDNTTPQAVYWVFKAYADQTGKRLRVSSDNVAVRAIASKNDAEEVIRILVGRYRYGSPVTVVIRDYPYTAPNGVLVKVKCVPNECETYKTMAKAKPLAAPLDKGATVVPLQNGALQFTLAKFNDGDAYIITCTPSSDPTPQ